MGGTVSCDAANSSFIICTRIAALLYNNNNNENKKNPLYITINIYKLGGQLKPLGKKHPTEYITLPGSQPAPRCKQVWQVIKGEKMNK